MTYELMKKAEKRTQEFFRKKYGLFWKLKVKPSIENNEYYSKFKEIIKEIKSGQKVERMKT